MKNLTEKPDLLLINGKKVCVLKKMVYICSYKRNNYEKVNDIIIGISNLKWL